MTSLSLDDRNQHNSSEAPTAILRSWRQHVPSQRWVLTPQTTRRHIPEDYTIIAVRIPILDGRTFAFHYATELLNYSIDRSATWWQWLVLQSARRAATKC